MLQTRNGTTTTIVTVCAHITTANDFLTSLLIANPKHDPYASDLATLSNLQIPHQPSSRHSYSHSSDSTSYRVPLPQLIFSRNDDVSQVQDFSEPSLSTPNSAPHSYYSPSLSDHSPLYESTMLDLSVRVPAPCGECPLTDISVLQLDTI